MATVTNVSSPTAILLVVQGMGFFTNLFQDFANRLRIKPLGARNEAAIRSEQKLDRLIHDVLFIKRRMSAYLGDGIALTFLADETPILVNSNDSGGPMNLIIGGLYEQDNLEVLLSYLRPHGIVVDVGANLGFFALNLGKRIRSPGHVYAFEPHPRLHDLASRSVYFNGLRERVTIHEFGLSDHEGPTEFLYPKGHLGGGRVHRASLSGDRPAITVNENGTESVQSEVRRLDKVLPAGMAIDLVKIDVEGHELQVLRGMKRIIRDSPTIAILFEKLSENAGNEAQIQRYLAIFGLELFGVQQGSTLEPLTVSAFRMWRGYVLAVRPEARGPSNRAFFSIYPSQLYFPVTVETIQHVAVLSGNTGDMLFHGPYWYLGSGLWTLRYEGKIAGRIIITIASRFGHSIFKARFDENTREHKFAVDHDLVYFECIAHAGSAKVHLELERLIFARLQVS